MIAEIETQRQEKEVGPAAGCGSALRKLHGLLDREKEASRLRGPAAGHP